MNIYKLVLKDGRKVEGEEFYCHRDNAVRAASRYIARGMGLKSSEVRIEDEVRYIGSRINFYDAGNDDRLNDIYIEVIRTNDEV